MAETAKEFAPGQHPELPPPKTEVGVWGWMYHNLFSSPLNNFLTFFGLFLCYLIFPPIIDWLFLDADWTGQTRDDCSREGACWVYIKVWFKQLMYGRYPDEELWRINTTYVIGTIGLAWLVIPRLPHKEWVGAFMLVIFPIICFFLFVGGNSLFNVPKWIAFFALIAAAYPALSPRVRTLPSVQTYRKFVFPVVSVLLLAFILFADLHPSASFDAGRGTAAVDVSADTITVPDHGFETGDAVVYSSNKGVVIGGLSTGQKYYALVVDDRTLKLAASREALEAGNVVNLQDFGEGVGHTISLAPPLQGIETPLWGGLFLTLVIATVGIVASLPIGIVLALGRRSTNMPVVKALCVGFIELWRGVPLITVLFMASVMFPLFLPEGMNFDKLIRALVGVMLFSAAYMAEVVRGGLQAIPKGQYEAADALGLSYWKSMALIILPQALKIVIPGIVNTFIGLFKDTTLVLIIGLFDFLGMAQAVATNPDWLGFAVEGYIFVGFGFWVFCFGMSRYSIYLEEKLHTGHRR